VIEAVIFDMDGVLIDTEPVWRRVERELFGELGIHLGDDELRQTMGFRIDETVAHWYAQRPWPDPDLPGLAARIVDRVVEVVEQQGEPLPGVEHAVGVCEKLGLRLAVASSSWVRLVDAVLKRLGIADSFEAVRSAADESYGKPHPGVFLTTAELLGVEPARCLVVEDSVNGMVAAVAARMRCVVVPERWDPRFVLADAVLDSLHDIETALPSDR
jgi:mannitol-1-/sugar-/sorbitol-6-/2-deoxyglucose-6-phosphatase